MQAGSHLSEINQIRSPKQENTRVNVLPSIINLELWALSGGYRVQSKSHDGCEISSQAASSKVSTETLEAEV